MGYGVFLDMQRTSITHHTTTSTPKYTTKNKLSSISKPKGGKGWRTSWKASLLKGLSTRNLSIVLSLLSYPTMLSFFYLFAILFLPFCFSFSVFNSSDRVLTSCFSFLARSVMKHCCCCYCCRRQLHRKQAGSISPPSTFPRVLLPTFSSCKEVTNNMNIITFANLFINSEKILPYWLKKIDRQKIVEEKKKIINCINKYTNSPFHCCFILFVTQLIDKIEWKMRTFRPVFDCRIGDKNRTGDGSIYIQLLLNVIEGIYRQDGSREGKCMVQQERSLWASAGECNWAAHRRGDRILSGR